MQPEMPTGDLLLGCDYEQLVRRQLRRQPAAALADNATYGAFRILRQDVAARSRTSCASGGQPRGADPELIAAKLMGRWRNGVPLVLSPHTVEPEPAVPRDKLNEFDYVARRGHPALLRRRARAALPVRRPRAAAQPARVARHGQAAQPAARPAEHALRPRARRRATPTTASTAASSATSSAATSRRSSSSSSACGSTRTSPPTACAAPASRSWARSPTAAGRSRASRRPRAGRPSLSGLPTLVTTRGSAYCLLPGIGGLRYLASLPDPKAVHG